MKIHFFSSESTKHANLIKNVLGYKSSNVLHAGQSSINKSNAICIQSRRIKVLLALCLSMRHGDFNFTRRNTTSLIPTDRDILDQFMESALIQYSEEVLLVLSFGANSGSKSHKRLGYWKFSSHVTECDSMIVQLYTQTVRREAGGWLACPSLLQTELTNIMTYGTRRLNAAFKRAPQ